MKPSPQSGLRVIVADDERDTRQLFEELLPHMGHQVVGMAQTGKELVEQCRRLNPDVVITDIRMPDMDGLEAAAAVNQERPVPVIIVSAYSDAETLSRASAGPVMTYLVKPVKPQDVQAALSVVMARSRNSRTPAARPPTCARPWRTAN